jgi:hypothetical protein
MILCVAPWGIIGLVLINNQGILILIMKIKN